jgi:hypothetical protein
MRTVHKILETYESCLVIKDQLHSMQNIHTTIYKRISYINVKTAEATYSGLCPDLLISLLFRENIHSDSYMTHVSKNSLSTAQITT